MQDAIIDRLKHERYLDNERYARAYCRDKLRFNGWGRIKIGYMLRGKGIEQEFIDAALADIDEEQYADILHEAAPILPAVSLIMSSSNED